MATVYLAHDLRHNRKVALKVLKPELAAALGAQRFLKEIQVTANLQHPHILPLFDSGSADGALFYVMPLVQGESLRDRLSREKLLPVHETIRIIRQVAGALDFAHRHGIIHRDIKPENILLHDGEALLTDFGIAIAPTAAGGERLTETGLSIGTLQYMSPEQAMGERDLDARSDIYALGAVTYEMLAGEPPVTGPTARAIIAKLLTERPTSLRVVRDVVPASLDDAVMRALAKAPTDRFSSAREFAEALTMPEVPATGLRKLQASLSIGSGLLVAPPRSSQVTAAVTQAWRRKPVKVAVVLVPLLIVGILFALRIWHPPLHQPSPEAKTWYDQGLVAMRAGTYYQASKRLERSVELDDQYALSHARLAETYLEINSTERAQEELLRAMSLPNADAAYLDAVAATVRRDFAAAIGYYHKILDQAPNIEKANAYVDLGRAYEKNENLDKAIESYREAIKRDPQSPTGFLRLATLYSRRQDSANAEVAFKEAEKLYRTMSNDEGRVEVLYQRGVLLARTGKLPEAKAQLEQVLEILKNVDNKYQLVRTQLQLSLVSRSEGNIDRAKELAAEAIRVAQTSNMNNIAAQGLIDLGLALLFRGDFDEAGKYFRQALDLARQDKSRSSEVRAILSLGRLNQQLGNNDEAISQLQDALKFYQSGGYRKETSIALTVLGRAYQDKGEDEIALKFFEQQLQLSKDSGDQASLADSHMNLALLRGYGQEMYPEALSHLDEKVKIDEAQGAKIQLGFDHMNRGNFLWQLGRYADARAALDSAFEISNRPGANYKAALAWVHLTRAQMALSERNYSEAKKNAQLALDVSASQFPDVTLQAKYCMGRADAFSGASQAGKKSCEEAVAMAKKVNAPQLISTALLALAEVLLIANDSKGALEYALEAQKILARSGQQDSEWRALLIAARASALTGNKSAAYDYASRAGRLCAGLEQKWGKEAYEGYLRRPDIQNYRNQITQILKLGK